MSTIRLPRSARMLAAGAVMFAGAGVTACDADEVGAAAVVGGERYTISELHDDVDSIANMPGSALDVNGDLTDLQMQLITENVRTAIFDQLAQDEGIDVTEASIDAYIEGQIAPTAPDGDLDALLAQNNFTPERLRAVVRIQLTANELFGGVYDQDAQALDEAVAAMADELGVNVNPRYGEWEGNAVSNVSGSVSVPVGETATP